MDVVSVFDAKNKLSALLDRVERGEEVTIARRGKVIAKLVPSGAVDRSGALLQRMQDLQDSIAARGERFTWAELKAYRDEDRR